MTIEIKKENYYVGIWFVPHNPECPVELRMDWLGTLYKEPGATTYKAQCRLRQHGSEDPNGSQDTKKWFRKDLPDPESLAKDWMDGAAEVIALGIGTDVEFIPVYGDGDKFVEELRKQEWAHVSEQHIN